MNRLLIVAALCLIASFALGKITAPPPAPETRATTASSPPVAARLLEPGTPPELSWDSIHEDPESAANDARDLPSGEHRDEWFRVIANEWTRTDATSALHWARSNLEGEDLQKFLATASNALASSSPREAATLVAQLAPGNLQSDAALEVLSHWASAQPDSATAWAEQFPGALRTRAHETLQARADPRQWAEGFPDGALEPQ